MNLFLSWWKIVGEISFWFIHVLYFTNKQNRIINEYWQWFIEEHLFFFYILYFFYLSNQWTFSYCMDFSYLPNLTALDITFNHFNRFQSNPNISFGWLKNYDEIVFPKMGFFFFLIEDLKSANPFSKSQMSSMVT